MSATRRFWSAVAILTWSTCAWSQSATPEAFVPLQGTWKVIGAEQGGRPVNALPGSKLIIGDDSFELQVAGHEFRGKIRVRWEGSPKQIDFLLPSTIWRGIFTLTDKTLRVHYVDVTDSAERPTLFATTADQPTILLVMQR